MVMAHTSHNAHQGVQFVDGILQMILFPSFTLEALASYRFALKSIDKLKDLCYIYKYIKGIFNKG